VQGLILIDKPKGISSFGVVARVRGTIKAETGQKLKVGHSGTLDPMATGLLVIAVGKYTKKIPELINKDKTYEVIMCLGKASSTGDSEGDIKLVSTQVPGLTELKTVLNSYTGKLMQTPPAFSAIKVNGQRAYKLARQGKEVKLQPRGVTVYDNKLVSYNYPEAEFIAKVSSGTYIRSLVEDIGKSLKTSAYMSGLRRTAIGSFRLSDAISLEELSYTKIQQHLFTLEK